LRHETKPDAKARNPETTVGSPFPMSTPSRALAGTVVTQSHRSRARVLARSFLDAHPEGRFLILIADGSAAPEEMCGVEWIGAEELDCPHLFEMQLRYSPFQLCSALKSTLARHALKCSPAGTFIYLDADTYVYRRCDELFDAAGAAAMVVLPHRVDAVPASRPIASESEFLYCGVFNAGCFGVNARHGADDILAWWEERVRFDAREAPEEGIYTDQKWLDLAPGIFPGVRVLRDPAYDVAIWNLDERPLERRGKRFLVQGRDLATFHFSGLDLTAGSFAEFGSLRQEIAPDSPLDFLVREYLRAHRELPAGRPALPSIRFDNGVAVDLFFRSAYNALSAAERDAFRDPFPTARPWSFYSWATSPRPPAGLSPYVEALHSLRVDLQRAFPLIHGSDRDGYLAWAVSSGSREHGYDAEQLGIRRLQDRSAREAGASPEARARSVRPSRPAPTADSAVWTRYFLRIDELESSAFPILAASLIRIFSPSSVIDLGCGAGGLLQELARQGVARCQGVDDRPEALEICRSRGLKVRAADLSRAQPIDRKLELAVCLEVASEIPRERARQFATNIAAGPDTLIFSVSSRALRSPDPLGELSLEFWIRLLARRGMILDPIATRRLRRECRPLEIPPWYYQGVRVFRRSSDAETW
jgi:SAM-dependent methyltransferase